MGEASLTIRPEGGRWRPLLQRNSSERARRFREQLGLPTDGALIMTGHQAEFWHPGILAKYLAADAAARACNAAVGWLVVDQDRAERVEVRYPVRRSGERDGAGAGVERLGVATVALGGGENASDGQKTASGFEFVERGLERIRGAMSAHAGEATTARKVAAALGDLMHPLLEHDRMPATVFATELSRTDLFAELVARMGREPERCIGLYNAAVSRHPTSGMRPLVADPVQDRWELPLWRLPKDGARRHVYAEELGSIPMEELAPKALLMTGLVRLAGCDLFVHGLGGGGGGAEEVAGHEGYDLVTEEWMRGWIGLAPGALAPITVVTATLHLPLLKEPVPGREQVARAVWLAHHARHNPDVLRDGYTADAKAKIVHAMKGAGHDGRHDLFRRMHHLLEAYRENHAADLAELDRIAAAARGRLEDAAVACDRTWAFPLYPDGSLEGLREEIDAAFAAGG